ncbi:MAG: MiaB/RimO family radical SAM methylthiotransferase, partial [Candidatus Latescibacteria bacterium]|nr:MiaB/RimO family radical SAM methylthiotransferase [Candidatus Latescibacterota bacterium]
MRRVYIETYGCQMNVADSELIASILRQAGYQIIPTPEEAEVILLNTCAVREHAEERVIGRASQLSGLRAHKPKLTLGILGCMAQHLAETLPQRAPFVDLVMGPDSYRRLPQILAETSEETLLDVRLDREEDYLGIDPIRRQGVNAWVTIMRGCDRFCTFCIVPFVRGRERSVSAEEILRQVRLLAAEGYQEVTLLGQTVNSYSDGHTDFAGLLRAVGQVEGLKRLRFTSPHPADFTIDVIDALAEVPQICPSFHLPLQSGSDAQLERMRRGYTVSQYRALVEELRRRLPGVALTTDLIAGFCGESESDFQQTL